MDILLLNQLLRRLASQAQISQLVVDTLSADVFFVGKATLGVPYGSPQWQVARMTIQGPDDVLEEYPNGSSDYVFVWSDRLSYLYSPSA